MAHAPISREEERLGLAGVAAANLIWGLLPLYLRLVGFAGEAEILWQRILWAAPSAFIAMMVMTGPSGLSMFRDARTMAALALSAVCIVCNWAIYVWAVAHGGVMEASLAYFITPLANVLLGVSFFGERLSRLQGGALLLAGLGVVVQGVALGGAPVVALALCASWTAYGVVRKSAPVESAQGLFAETALLTPVAFGLMAFLPAPARAPDQAILLALLGPLTAAPLVFFAIGARRLNFTALGLLQFGAPSLQFIVALLLGEEFSLLRAVSFVLIWASLAVFTLDAVMRARALRAPSAEAG